MKEKNIAFLFSGRGSLLNSVIQGIKKSQINAQLSLVITNNTLADKSLFSKYNFHIIDHTKYDKRKSFELAIMELLEKNKIDLIVLGGFRRIFSPEFVLKYGNITINTHPSILPAFPGDHAQKKAIQSGVKITGATIHFINNEVDRGPIIDQDIVKINTKTLENELREKIIKVEEKMITNAVSDFLNGYLVIDKNRVINLKYENN